jgi:hypothetical protein
LSAATINRRGAIRGGMNDHSTPDKFEGIGKRRHDRKVIVKCLGPLCRGKRTFESESKNIRLCGSCRKHINKLRGGMA